ncbi:MAG: type II toxin-antitoxin system VapC family toxin [Vulcanimicrobiaceae bacterium]
MILVDTSVWIDHFRFGNAKLSEMLEQELVLTHPFVVGELACGNLRGRARILQGLEALPSVISVDHQAVLYLIDGQVLWGKGLGLIDCHLLASTLLSNCHLWTLDKSLEKVAAKLGVIEA